MNFTVATEGNLELGLSANLRFIGPIDPGPGSSNYLAPAGTTGGDANWDFLFSINTADGTGTAGTLADFTFSMNITDITNGNPGPVFNPVSDIHDDTFNGPGGMTVGIATLLPADFGAQNAENLSFAGFLPGFDPNAGDTYAITLDAFDSRGALVDSDTITVEAVLPTPEPSAIFLSGTLLLFCGRLLAKRRSKVNSLG